MKTNIGNNIKLGLFVSIGIVCLVVGVYLIGSRQLLFRQTFRISSTFRDVGGLQVGNNVRLSGVRIGTVDLVSIVSDSMVKVELVIDETKRRFIRKDAIASIGSEGLLGSKVLNIAPGNVGSPNIINDGTIEAALPIDLDNILASLNTGITNTVNITNDLYAITKSIRTGEGTLGKLIMDQSIAQNLDSSLTNLKHSSNGLKFIVEKAQHGFTRDLDSTLTYLKHSSNGLRTIVERAQHGFSNDLDSTMTNLKYSSYGLRMIVDKAQVGFSNNLDTTMTNLRTGSTDFNVLIKKAKKSWLLWGFR